VTDVFGVLFVCTGNVCRSAMADVLARSWLAHAVPGLSAAVRIESAGTGAPVGAAMSEPAQQLMREAGVLDPGAHRARALDRDLVRSADLVLTATREHRAAVVRMLPSAARRVFTVREIAELAGRVPPERLAGPRDTAGDMRAAVRIIAGQRGMGRGDTDAWDLEDPIGRPLGVYRHVLGEMWPALAEGLGAVLSVTFPQPPQPPPAG